MSIQDEDFRDAPERDGRAPGGHPALPRAAQRHVPALPRRAPPPGATEWNSAAPDNESLLRLTAAELTELGTELLALAKKYDEKGRAAEAAGDTEGRENVALHVYGFPFRP